MKIGGNVFLVVFFEFIMIPVKAPAHLAVSQHIEDQGSSSQIISDGGMRGECQRVTGSSLPLIMARINLCIAILSPVSRVKVPSLQRS